MEATVIVVPYELRRSIPERVLQALMEAVNNPSSENVARAIEMIREQQPTSVRPEVVDRVRGLVPGHLLDLLERGTFENYFESVVKGVVEYGKSRYNDGIGVAKRDAAMSHDQLTRLLTRAYSLGIERGKKIQRAALDMEFQANLAKDEERDMTVMANKFLNPPKPVSMEELERRSAGIEEGE